MSPARFLRIFTCFAVLALMVGNTFGQVQSSTHEPVVGVIERVRKPDFTITNADSAGQGIIAYSPDGNYLVVAAGESVRFYDTSLLDGSKADLKRTLSGHALRILGFAFSDTNTLVSVSMDQTVKMWDIETGKMLHSAKLQVAEKSGFCLALGTNSLAADKLHEKVRLWNYRSGEILKTFEPGDSWPSALAFTPNGKSLVIGTEKGVLRVMDVATWKVARIVDLDSPILSLAASTEHIVMGYSDGTVATLNLGDQALVPERKKQSGAISALAFSPSGKEFASASADHFIKVWDVTGLNPLYSLEGHGAPVVAVSFSPDGKRLVSMDEKGVVNFWTVRGE